MEAETEVEGDPIAGTTTDHGTSDELEQSYAYAYDEDPIADAAWIEEYTRECERRQETYAMWSERLRDKTSRDSW